MVGLHDRGVVNLVDKEFVVNQRVKAAQGSCDGFGKPGRNYVEERRRAGCRSLRRQRRACISIVFSAPSASGNMSVQIARDVEEEAPGHGEQRQNDQRAGHGSGRFVRVRVPR